MVWGWVKKHFQKATEEALKKNSVNFSINYWTLLLELSRTKIRFSTSNPQDMTIDVIQTMTKHKNICKYIHLPVLNQVVVES